jgi:hypothetical protein
LAFGGSTSANTKPHTHNQTLQNDGGDLSETLTDMNGVALYSLITDNTAAVAANTVNIATNTAAIAAIGEVPSGGVITYTLSGIPAGWTLYEDIASTISQTTQDRGRDINTGTGSWNNIRIHYRFTWCNKRNFHNYFRSVNASHRGYKRYRKRFYIYR